VLGLRQHDLARAVPALPVRDVELDEAVQPHDLETFMVRQEQMGNTYALTAPWVHAAAAELYTVSLIVRGSSVKDRFLVMDPKTRESW
jgi:hypothetical protein